MRRQGLRRRRKASKGAAIVELAFVFPLMIAILLVIADLGVFLFLHQALVSRASRAARWGAVSDPSNTTAIRNMVLYGRSAGGATPSFGLTPDMVQVSELDTGTDNYRLIVSVSGYSFRLITPWLGGTYAGRPISVSVPLGPYE